MVFCHQHKKERSNHTSYRQVLSILLALVLMAANASMLGCVGGIWGEDQATQTAALASGILSAASSEAAEIKQPQGMDESLYAYYALLSSSEKVIYEEVLSCIEKGEAEVIPSYPVDKETITKILSYIRYDQPQLFWYENGQTKLEIGTESGRVFKVQLNYNDLISERVSGQQCIAEIADQLISEATSLSDLEAERFFHDYLCQNVAYEEGANDQNIYSTFIEHKTVCAGYARAMQYLMNRRGIPCYYCVGSIYDEEEQATKWHAWNIVALNGNYYNCDVTYDDFYQEAEKYPSYIAYENFNAPDSQNGERRTRSDEGLLLPACTADDMTYQAQYGAAWEREAFAQLGLSESQIIDSVDGFLNYLYAKVTTDGIGSHSLTFAVKGADIVEQIDQLTNEEYTDRLFSPIADYLGYPEWEGASWEYSYYSIYPYDEYFYYEFTLDFY